jgi:hypothetical protein
VCLLVADKSHTKSNSQVIATNPRCRLIKCARVVIKNGSGTAFSITASPKTTDLNVLLANECSELLAALGTFVFLFIPLFQTRSMKRMRTALNHVYRLFLADFFEAYCA